MAQVEPSSKRKGGRSPGFVYSSLATVLVVVIATLTITAAQTPPPAIAEFAPEAIEQIKDPPPSQASEFGSGEGGEGIGGVETTTTTAPPAVVRRAPRTRTCVSQPGFAPRQTEDPQSPPCVALWEGDDNGGATSKGVTRDEIIVAVPSGDGRVGRDLLTLEAYFNKRYEFYGRKLRLVGYKAAPNFTTGDKMQADAVVVDEQLKAFASLSYTAQRGQESVYYNALAQRKIISVAASFLGTPSSTEADLTRNAPYQWNYYAPVDLIQQNLAEVVCKQLVGKPAAFAGPPESTLPERRFGLMVDVAVRGAPPLDPDPLLVPTRRCGAQWDVYNIDFPSPDVPNAAQDSTRDVMLQMQDNGVTTIACLCAYSYLLGAMQNASVNGYNPEYITQNFGIQDVDYTANAFPGGQDGQGRIFGLRTTNKALPRDQMPYWQAMREIDASVPEDANNFNTGYWNLLVLASGIQLAGPNLTPETFAEGLHRARFPNPHCGTAPFYQACVGFQDRTHTMIKDFTMVWWDPNAQSVELDYTKSTNAVIAARGDGAYCYSELGTRYSLGTWPTGDPEMFGTNPCR